MFGFIVSYMKGVWLVVDFFFGCGMFIFFFVWNMCVYVVDVEGDVIVFFSVGYD